MKGLPTQFDESRRTSAVATPTCSSCCCCCCCLGTVVTSSTMLAQRIQVEGRREATPFRGLLTVLAAMIWPLVALLTAASYGVLSAAFRKCEVRTIEMNYLDDYQYTHCTETGPLAVALAVLFAMLIGSFVYWRVGMSRPVGRAAVFLLATIAAFAAEFVAGGMILIATLSSDGGGYAGLALYLVLAAAASGTVMVKYGRGIRRASEARSNGSATLAVPPGPQVPPMPPIPPGPPIPPTPPSPLSPPSTSSHPEP